MVMMLEFGWAVVSLALYIVILFYNYQVISNFHENEKVAATRLFLEGRTATGFKAFTLGMMVWGLCMVLGVIAFVETDQIYRYSSKAGALALFVAWLYFMRTLAMATDIPHEDD